MTDDNLELVLIVAMAKNGVIGVDGDLPWRIPDDLKRFKKLTLGHPCIMGDVTYESLPPKFRPLPGRENIVLTLDPEYEAPGATVKYSWDEALDHCKGKEVAFICGGATIYREGIKRADRLEITLVERDVDGDTYFPVIDYSKWEETNREPHDGFTFLTYQRKVTD
jgi:dihydrofolate reductase